MNPADEKVAVPLNAPKLSVRVVALHKDKDPGPFRYLQGIRQGTLRILNPDPEQTAVALSYHTHKHRFFPALAAKVGGSVDAVLSPPSSLPEQAEPYRKAIAAAHPSAIDLTNRFARIDSARAGEGAKICDVFNGLSYDPLGQEKNIRRLVICDDTFNTGTTATAIVKLMRKHGLADECEVIVACPLWLELGNTH
jgi:hypothetical protein